MRSDPYVALTALEHDWAEAWCHGKQNLCAHLIADDFVEIDGHGKLLSKAEWLDEMATHAPKSVEWIDIRVRPFGRTAVVHCRVLMAAGSGNGNPHVPGRGGLFLFTDVWVFRGAEWVVVSRHITGPVHGQSRAAQPRLHLVGGHQ